MSLSAINVDNRTILPGMPIVVANGGAKQAGGGVLATALAFDGAVTGGVLRYAKDGTLELKNWGKITGSTLLIPNATYYVGEKGMLTLGSSGQAVGVASSKFILQVSVASAITRSYEVIEEPEDEPGHMWPCNGRPKPDLGVNGDWAFDRVNKELYGPKSGGLWNEPCILHT